MNRQIKSFIASTAILASLVFLSLNASAESKKHWLLGGGKKDSEESAKVQKSTIGYYKIQNKRMGPCPVCANRDWTIPSHFGLRATNPSGYGPTKTYYIMSPDDQKLLTADQKTALGRVIKPRRTGYSKPNNSGNTHAGWAAVRRSGTTGLTNLGPGTLNNPRTVAVSPGAALAQEVCQGDMIYDCQFGWMRVEGGCTSGGLGERIDVWMGTVSTGAVQADWINQNVPMKVFPAGMIPKDFAENYTKPKQSTGVRPQACF